MGTSNATSKRARLSKEVEEIRRLRDLGQILKAGDMENALLSNAAKDSETMNDNVIDALLSKANYEGQRGGSEKNLEMIEKLTTTTGTTRVIKQKKAQVKKSKGKAKAKSSKKKR